ncbi:unnamed protein product [Amoebophrya sp. A120]|nr:unnamed protein product [Amoebophrya sp. A120]|eukprot:GSA120T00000939001.1
MWSLFFGNGNTSSDDEGRDDHATSSSRRNRRRFQNDRETKQMVQLPGTSYACFFEHIDWRRNQGELVLQFCVEGDQVINTTTPTTTSSNSALSSLIGQPGSQARVLGPLHERAPVHFLQTKLVRTKLGRVTSEEEMFRMKLWQGGRQGGDGEDGSTTGREDGNEMNAGLEQGYQEDDLRDPSSTKMTGSRTTPEPVPRAAGGLLQGAGPTPAAQRSSSSPTNKNNGTSPTSGGGRKNLSKMREILEGTLVFRISEEDVKKELTTTAGSYFFEFGPGWTVLNLDGYLSVLGCTSSAATRRNSSGSKGTVGSLAAQQITSAEFGNNYTGSSNQGRRVASTTTTPSNNPWSSFSPGAGAPTADGKSTARTAGAGRASSTGAAPASTSFSLSRRATPTTAASTVVDQQLPHGGTTTSTSSTRGRTASRGTTTLGLIPPSSSPDDALSSSVNPDEYYQYNCSPGDQSPQRQVNASALPSTTSRSSDYYSSSGEQVNLRSSGGEASSAGGTSDLAANVRQRSTSGAGFLQPIDSLSVPLGGALLERTNATGGSATSSLSKNPDQHDRGAYQQAQLRVLECFKDENSLRVLCHFRNIPEQDAAALRFAVTLCSYDAGVVGNLRKILSKQRGGHQARTQTTSLAEEAAFFSEELAREPVKESFPVKYFRLHQMMGEVEPTFNMQDFQGFEASTGTTPSRTFMQRRDVDEVLDKVQQELQTPPRSSYLAHLAFEGIGELLKLQKAKARHRRRVQIQSQGIKEAREILNLGNTSRQGPPSALTTAEALQLENATQYSEDDVDAHKMNNLNTHHNRATSTTPATTKQNFFDTLFLKISGTALNGLQFPLHIPLAAFLIEEQIFPDLPTLRTPNTNNNGDRNKLFLQPRVLNFDEADQGAITCAPVDVGPQPTLCSPRSNLSSNTNYLKGQPAESLSSKRTNTAATQCVTCLAEKSDLATFVHGSTGHTVCCYACANKIYYSRQPLCPICRDPIQAVIQTFGAAR